MKWHQTKTKKTNGNMINFRSPEYRILEECLEEWLDILVSDEPFSLDLVARQEASRQRIISANADYYAMHGKPTPDEIRVLEPYRTKVLMLSGGITLWRDFHDLLHTYNLGVATSSYFEMVIVLPYDTDLSSEDALRLILDFPHWRMRLAENNDNSSWDFNLNTAQKNF